MAKRDIIVVGASAGGVSALIDFVGKLPRDLPAALFIVLHVPPYSPSNLPEILTKSGPLPAHHPKDGEKIRLGRIYVAPPDRHLLLAGEHVLVKHGPKENRFRPSVDALFRSAAYVHGSRVIGIVLSGALDDGTSGLWTIKRCGGTTIVQEPGDAIFPDMPANALEQVEVDQALPVPQMGAMLEKLVRVDVSKEAELSAEERERIKLEIKIATHDNAFEMGIMEMGDISPFTCPECHGALVQLKEGNRIRFRCHTGHSFTPSSLLAGLTQVNEEKLWQAMRGFEEASMLLEHLAKHFQESGHAGAAKLFLSKARGMKDRAQVIHDSVLDSENLSEDIRRDDEHGTPKET